MSCGFAERQKRAHMIEHLRVAFLPEVTEARTGRLRRELELLRSHPKDERGVWGDWAMCPDGP